MSPELRELLDEYLSKAPPWRRWLAQSALAIAAPQAQPRVIAVAVFGLLVATVIVVAGVYAVWEIGCWVGAWQNLC